MYKFIKIKDPNNEFDKSNVKVTIPFNDITLDDLCESFKDFLNACGFYLNNKIVAIIPDPDYIDKKDEDLQDNDILVSDSDKIYKDL